jgi:hypothetical protein
MTAKTEGLSPVLRRQHPVAARARTPHRASDHGSEAFPDAVPSLPSGEKQCPLAHPSANTTAAVNPLLDHLAPLPRQSPLEGRGAARSTSPGPRPSGPPAMTAFKPVESALVDDVDVVEHEPTDATRRLLRLMRTGAIDETIARELGVSIRTVHRRITRLQNLLGARSRFQLGVVACERGWV